MQPPTPPVPEDVRVIGIVLKAKVIISGPDGKVKADGFTNEITISEADFTPAVIEILRAKGLMPTAEGPPRG